MQKRDLLIALHRRLYILEESGKNLSVHEREDLYVSLRSIIYNDRAEINPNIISKYISKKDLAHVADVLKWAKEKKVRITTWYDEDYPFWGVSQRPPVVYIYGEFPKKLEHPYIAIVGARKATLYGKKMTKAIVRGLAPYSPTIISGLAYGIDKEAHLAAIENNLPTVAVLGSGIDNIYPRGHLSIAMEIIKNGAIVSEFPLGTPPLKFNFPLRNRIISGVSKGVLVVEAMEHSGSLITAKWAADQGKEVFAVPGNVGSSMSKGTNLLIKDGAYLVEDGNEIAELLKLENKALAKIEKNSGHIDEYDDIKRAILNFLKIGGNNLENLAQETGLSVNELLPLVTEVEVFLSS